MPTTNRYLLWAGQLIRTLIIEPAGQLWGSERALLNWIAVFPCDQIKICCPAGTPLHQELKRLGFVSAPYLGTNLHNKSKWHRLKSAWGIFRACLEFHPEVIYLNQCGIIRIAIPAAICLKIPIVGHVRLFEEVGYLARQSNIHLKISRLIVPSSAVEEEIRKWPKLRSIPVDRIYDSYGMSGNPDKGKKTRSVICAGRIDPMKGQELLIEAIALVNQHDDSVQYIIAGNGDKTFVQKLKSRASQLKIDNLSWLGFVQNVGDLLSHACVLAVPSSQETFGRVILEAWDAGVVPVVFGGNGGAAEIVSAANGGIIFDEKSPQSLAESLKLALSLSEKDHKELIANGREWIEQYCNPKKYADTITDVLEKTVSDTY